MNAESGSPREPETPPCDVIIDPRPSSGSRNMAVDAALLECSGDRCVVRVYRWREPTVSLGYFQKNRAEVPQPLSHLPVVPRLSGGGAILHHHELTYSCVLPVAHPLRHNPSQLYPTIHQALIACLQRRGVDCLLRSEHSASAPGGGAAPAGEPFLCFLRQDGNDIVTLSGQKIVGSAQRRRRGTTLQHGSILLRRSACEPSVSGICDHVDTFDESSFADELPGVIARAISGDISARQLSARESAAADRIEAEIIGQFRTDPV